MHPTQYISAIKAIGFVHQTNAKSRTAVNIFVDPSTGVKYITYTTGTIRREWVGGWMGHVHQSPIGKMNAYPTEEARLDRLFNCLVRVKNRQLKAAAKK